MNVIVKFYALAVLLVTFRSDIMVMKPAEVESRTQGSRPTPRTLKNFEAKAKDRPSRGQGLRTQTQELLKKGLQKFFSGDLQKKSLQKFFSGNLYLRKPKKRSLQIFRKVSGVFQRNFNGSKIVLSSSRGQGNFRGLEASRPRTSKCVLEDSTSGNQAETRERE